MIFCYSARTMLMIRFQRIGRRNDPAFRIVLLDKKRAAQSGGVIERLGTYNPKSKSLTLNAERAKEWIAQGVQLTDSVKNILITRSIIEGKKVNALPRRTPIKKEKEKEAEPTAQTPIVAEAATA